MSTLRRLYSSVQKVTKLAGLSPEEATLTRDMVVGISSTGSCQLSKVARARYGDGFRKAEHRLSEGLAKGDSGLDALEGSYVRSVAGIARTMPFVAVDLEDISKKHGKAFENLCIVRDASEKDKPLRPGFWCVSIDASTSDYRHLPLVRHVFSTTDPDFSGWWETIGRALLMVVEKIGTKPLFLFDRGFDAYTFMAILNAMKVRWLIRQRQDRNILVGGQKILMASLVSGLTPRHEMTVPFIDKSNHRERQRVVRFTYVSVGLPDLPGRYTLIVVHTGGPEPIVLLTNQVLTDAEQVAGAVRAFWRRWGSEEVGRFWKQSTRFEDVRVRGWEAVRRVAVLSLMAIGLQALWLVQRPSTVQALIRRARSFLAWVRFVHYRLWEGTRVTLAKRDRTLAVT